MKPSNNTHTESKYLKTKEGEESHYMFWVVFLDLFSVY